MLNSLPFSETVDIAVNIFAKPFQTALSLLSLLKYSGSHIGTIYLQFEPVGSKYDPISTYFIAQWLKQTLDDRCQVFQPEYWLDLKAPDPAQLKNDTYRLGIRYQYAIEHSQAKWLFLMHNDVLFLKDILGDMLDIVDDAFAIGELGQCWNCPASREEITQEVMQQPACTSDTYLNFRPNMDQLHQLYTCMRQKGFFCRPYDIALPTLSDATPWTLPECRVNEWACLINLEKTRQYTIPFGPALPPGAFRQCHYEEDLRLDTAVEWFRQMHQFGMYAKNFVINKHMLHWKGTGKKAKGALYIEAERKALKLLQRYYPHYIVWLEKTTGENF